MRNCLGDIRTLQPTIMVGVPAVWETIRKGIVSKVRSSGALKSKVFDLGVAAKRFGGRGSFLGNLADKVVFEAVKQGTGGKLKYAMSGGAPISKETQEFLSIALVLIIQGCVRLSPRLSLSRRQSLTLALARSQLRHDRVDCVRLDFPLPHSSSTAADLSSSPSSLSHAHSMCCILPPEMHQYQTVGVPVPSCEVKLVDGASCHLTSSLSLRACP